MTRKIAFEVPSRFCYLYNARRHNCLALDYCKKGERHEGLPYCFISKTLLRYKKFNRGIRKGKYKYILPTHECLENTLKTFKLK